MARSSGGNKHKTSAKPPRQRTAAPVKKIGETDPIADLSTATGRAHIKGPKPAKTATTKRSGSDSKEERLHKRIAASGLCSRRAAEELIREGRVEVNGEVVIEMGVKVSPEDEVRVDGRPIGVAKAYTLIMNKPVGYLTTLSDPQGRPTVKKLLPTLGALVKPVGRLDMDTEGLLLFTNDGLLAQRLAHPRFGVEKEYQATVQGIPEEEALDRLRKGVYIEEGGKTAPAKVQRVHEDRRHGTAVLRITIHEGRKRQVRLMFEAIGHPVLALKRIRIGPLVLKNLPAGACRMLGKVELDKLRQLVGL